MTININIDNAVAETGQSCSTDSVGTEGVLALYIKVATALALVLCACLASGFVTILRAIRAVHAELVTTRTGEHAQNSSISENSTESFQPNADAIPEQEAEATTAADSSEETEMLGTWREVGNVTLVWLGRSVSAMVTGIIPGFTPDGEAEYELPGIMPMTP